MDRARSLLDGADFQSIGRPRPSRPRRAGSCARWSVVALLLAGVGVVTLRNLGYLSGSGVKAPPPSAQDQTEFEGQKTDSEARFNRGEISKDGV